MLFGSVVGYLAVTMLIGLWAARRVRNEQDFLLAGRSLPLYMEAATLFATWYGAETVLGASATFAEEGLVGVAEDPFGASLCLILVGAFFARRLYRMQITTFGDFYRNRYGSTVELLASIFLVFSYFGWIAAQMVAIGKVLHVIYPDVSVHWGIFAGCIVVTLYTFAGGMWSVSITDLVQGVLIVVGLSLALGELHLIKPIGEVLSQTPAEHFRFLPKADLPAILNYIAAWFTIGLGSIPQQDVFQRVMSARTERIAVQASYWGAGLYLTIALIPLVLALYGHQLLQGFHPADHEQLLPQLILTHTPVIVQILFFGALLSAIMSTASGATLAPAAIISENIIGHFILKGQNQKHRLFTSRMAVLLVAAVSLMMAYMGSSIYELVGASSALSLVSLFVPMVAGIYWKRASRTGALLSMLLGMAVWMYFLYLGPEEESANWINPILYGLTASIVGMVIGVIRDSGLGIRGVLTTDEHR